MVTKGKKAMIKRIWLVFLMVIIMMMTTRKSKLGSYFFDIQ